MNALMTCYAHLGEKEKVYELIEEGDKVFELWLSED